MKARQDHGQVIDLLRRQPVLRCQLVKLPGERKTAHEHCIFQGRQQSRRWRLRTAAANGNGIQIYLRCQAAIEPNLLFAVMAARCQAAVIQKSQIERFFNFVCVAAGKQDPGNVRLDQSDFFGGMRIAARIQQALD